MRITVTDCDHESTEIEREVAELAGHELSVTSARTEDEVIAAAEGASAIIVQYAPVSRRVIEALPALRAIGRYGVGYDTVDVDAATECGIAVCTVPDYGTDDVSDHAIALAVALARRIPQLDAAVRRGEWELAPVKPLHRFSSRVFAVLGLGAIGAATARKAAGLGFQVIGHDPAVEPGIVTSEGVHAVTLDELVSRADVLSLHVPLLAATRHLVGTELLRSMKPDAVLVNTCRGPVVDTDALVAALRENALAGAALDVFEEEPLPRDHALRTIDNVILTPHAGWYSEESYVELKRRVVENVCAVLAGRTPRNIVNPAVLESE
ncbi:MAG: 2-hydroxyacid dehydrogenase [Microbacteriaceae bacterium]|nr:2-hydroxyacid dehydrogenase [Microbacteriaceae bacterium]